MRFRVAIQITPRHGILDPQGKAIADALQSLGFETIATARVGRHILVELGANDEEAAAELARTMCSRLLANPVTEDYEIAEVARA